MDAKNPFTRTMFHATHRDNIASIIELGLLPGFATGKRKAVWFVPKNGIQSGILHAAARHNWHVSEMVLFVVEVVAENIRYSGNGMLFYSSFAERAETCTSALLFLDEETLP